MNQNEQAEVLRLLYVHGSITIEEYEERIGKLLAGDPDAVPPRLKPGR